MVKAGKQKKKVVNPEEEMGQSQQKLSRSAGVLHVKRKGKEVKVPLAERFDEEDDDSGAEGGCPYGKLPRLIFKKDEMPKDGRINTHSRIERLTEILEVLEGTPEQEWIMNSPFGPLFGLQTRHCEFSGRLVHGLLCRSLVTTKKHEMWFVFGGKPLRFSLKEFAMITGLNCNPLPTKKEIKRLQTPEEQDEDYWNYLIGKPKTMTIDGIVRMLTTDKKLPPEEQMDPERRLRLCLIVIVEGILCVRSSAVAATKGTVEMVKDLDSFCAYPWGRESFELTLRMVNVGEKVKTIETLAGKLHQSHFSNHGFTLAYQLLAVYTIPLLEKIIPVKDFDSYFTDPYFSGLAKAKPFHNANILAAEENPNLVVESLLSTGHSVDEWDLSWDDEVDDPRVETILLALKSNYVFKPSDWKAQRIQPIHRRPKARAKAIMAEKMYADLPGDSGKYAADRLVVEGDRLMETFLTRKHDFEFKEMEILREGYRNLLIKALTINEHCREWEKSDIGIAEEQHQRTPVRKVDETAEAESLSSDDHDSEPLKRKNRRKSARAKGKRVKADVSDEGGEGDRKKKKSRVNERCESPRVMKGTDLVGTSITDIVHEVEKMHGTGGAMVETDDVNEPAKGMQVEASETTLDIGLSVDHKMADNNPEQTVVLPEEEQTHSDNDEPACEQKEMSDHHMNVDAVNSEDAVDPVVHPEVPKKTTGIEHMSPIRDSGVKSVDSHAGSTEETVAKALPVEVQLTEVAVDPVVQPEEPITSTGAEHTSPVRDSEREPIDSHAGSAEYPGAEDSVLPPMDSQTVAEEEPEAKLLADEVEPELSEPMDSHEGATHSHVGASREMVADDVDKNYCSGYEDDDVVQTTVDTVKETKDVGGERGAVLALRSTRARTAPVRFGQTPEEKKQDEEEEDAEYDPLRPVSETRKKLFLKALDSRKAKDLKVLGVEVKKTFFRELMKQKQHVSTPHMEAMLSSLWSRRGEELRNNKVAVMDSWFCQYLEQEHGRYCKSKNPPVPFKWHQAIVNYVAGNIENREGELRWMVDVEQLYAPMAWGGNHWVALNINLVSGTVNILDCNQNLTANTKIPRRMKPILEVLPLILRDLVDPGLDPADSFDFIRGVGVTQNERSGDCGPLTVKFIELDGQGYSLDGISEEQVDEIRLRYAVEVFEANGNSL